MKTILLTKKIKAGKTNVNVAMNVSYRLDHSRRSKSLLKRGCHVEDITRPLKIPFYPDNVKTAKKAYMDCLLKQRFGDE
ncbi:hypothetical protein ANN_18612 [Periplaneta americana]|uniref:Uncharacterized protein n=1 Tax=Periplaneta americana TaxID=6978 RepID=A0ABQ8SP81_PERAM|nr:hypothetical protein ANN_18612 [Periplaneta americana]